MKAINHVSERGLGGPGQGLWDRGFVGTGGLASVSGLASFMANTVGENEGYKGGT